MDLLEIFDGCSGDILWVSWSYLMGVLEILNGCIGYIYLCYGDI